MTHRRAPGSGQRRLRFAAALSLLALAAACGGRGDASDSLAASDDARSLIAGSLPRVVYHGGPFLRSPRVVTVTFQGDDPALVARLARFGERITRTTWWRTVTAGYCAPGRGCIGDGRPGAHVHLRERLPERILDVEVGALLARAVSSGRLGAVDGETLLLAYLPRGVVLADAFTRYCAGGPRAVHRALRLDGVAVAYAVMPRCGGERQLTASASHEIVEAATNPDPSARGFSFVRHSPTLGFTAAGVEPADPCGLLHGERRLLRESGFTVHRAWSNAAARRGEDPCVPAPPSPLLALVPETPVVRLVGSGARARVRLQAAGPATAWSVAAKELTHSGSVEVELDRARVAAGETAYLKVTLRRETGHELAVVGIVSRRGRHESVWPVAVVTR